jgi:hypothetical protein
MLRLYFREVRRMLRLYFREVRRFNKATDEIVCVVSCFPRSAGVRFPEMFF